MRSAGDGRRPEEASLMVVDIRDEVRRRYAAAARAAGRGERADDLDRDEGDCGPPGPELYGEPDRGALPESAVLASLGCGNPTAVAELREGDVVLDLGSGGGIDVLLSARRVGPTGMVYGLDMTDEMLEIARANAREAGATNVEFLKGFLEDVPVPDGSIDVLISNCVINLSADKPAAFSEMRRVLRPGGRIGITDIVAEDDLTPEQRAERGSFVGCIAGALSFTEYADHLKAAGFVDVEIESTHEVADRMHGAIIRARKPVTDR
jgi:SAM-dependent methyltransferase